MFYPVSTTAWALVEPSHLSAITATSFRALSRLALRCTLRLLRALALGRLLPLRGTLLLACGMTALRLPVPRLAATAAALRALVGIRVAVARLAMALMPAGMRRGAAALLSGHPS